MIIVNQENSLINASNDLLTITVTSTNPVLLSSSPAPIIESNNPVLTIIAKDNNGLVKTIGVQGPSGPQGPQGPSGGSSLSHVAPINLGGGRVVTGAFGYADSSDLSTTAKAIGFTVGAVSAGQVVSIILSGESTGFFGLTPNGIIYLSTNGTITQTPPSIGYIQKLGVALDSTTILINIQEPIVL
jgi:hypothetical protein